MKLAQAPLLDGQDMNRLAVVTLGFLSVLFGVQALISMEVPVEPAPALVGYCDGKVLFAQEEDEFEVECQIIERIRYDKHD